MTRSIRTRERGRRWIGWLALPLVMPGCGEEPIPTVGVVLSGSFVGATTLGVEDRRQDERSPFFEAIMIREASARSSPALRAAAELVATPGMIGVVAHSNSSASLAAARVYNEHRVVQIAPTTAAPIYSGIGPYSFRLVPSDSVQGAFLAQVVADSFPEGARLAILYVNDDYGRGLRGALLNGLDPDRHGAVLDLPHAENEVGSLDATHHADALIAADPDLVIWLGRVAPLALILQELDSRQHRTQILAGDAIAQAYLQTDIPLWWEGIWFSDFFDPEGSPALQDFQTRFDERFGARSGTAEALAYDGIQLILAAVAEGARSGDQVKEYLDQLGRERLPYPGITGPIQFDADGDVDRSFVLRRINLPREAP